MNRFGENRDSYVLAAVLLPVFPPVPTYLYPMDIFEYTLNARRYARSRNVVLVKYTWSLPLWRFLQLGIIVN